MIPTSSVMQAQRPHLLEDALIDLRGRGQRGFIRIFVDEGPPMAQLLKASGYPCPSSYSRAKSKGKEGDLSCRGHIRPKDNRRDNREEQKQKG